MTSTRYIDIWPGHENWFLHSTIHMFNPLVSWMCIRVIVSPRIVDDIRSIHDVCWWNSLKHPILNERVAVTQSHWWEGVEQGAAITDIFDSRKKFKMGETVVAISADSSVPHYVHHRHITYSRLISVVIAPLPSTLDVFVPMLRPVDTCGAHRNCSENRCRIW